ncbi:hypothetical protein [Rhizobium sp. Root1220]|uniref:hypothetical protein n=1 Tax=Rhizobium sp. Root1220 TaxID=1736432 RepID=UPI0006F2CAF6|nr:hypothetical protein [Rhizobium sp. Root1220]KQV84431.1 hypothetical protein ASC90_02670 [Rhizobium sp. Root1220]
MRFPTVLLTVLTLASGGVAPEASFATDWKRAGEAHPQLIYPYPNLPGVRAQPEPKDEEQYRCRTETQLIRRRHDQIFRSGGIPTLVYVCDGDGLESRGVKVPLRGHYQPVR